MYKLVFLILCLFLIKFNFSKITKKKNLFDTKLIILDEYLNINVWITINSNVVVSQNPFKSHVKMQRQLELNWFLKNTTPEKSGWIGFFTKAPIYDTEVTTDQALFYSYLHPNQTYGKIVTDLTFPVINFYNQTQLIKGCLNYYIAYVRENKVLASNCIHTFSTWMTDMKNVLFKTSLRDLMLPGTHNSGAYSIGYVQTNLAKRKLNDYTLCQDESIYNQLIYGIRLFDFRVNYKGGNRFMIAHDIITINHEITDILKQIKRFLDLTIGELIILDFHRFPSGFTKDLNKQKELHQKLFEIIKKTLGKYIAPRVNQRYLVKFGSLIENNQRVIIGYSEESKLKKEDRVLVYPASTHIWKDKNDSLDKLLPFLKQKVCSTSSTDLEAAAAFLTPTAAGVVLNKYKSLRVLANKVNRVLTDNFREYPWFNCSNGVLTDYFLGNNLIQLSIESNYQRNIKKN